MRTTAIHLISFIIGVFLFGAGLLYLTQQYRAVNQLIILNNEKISGDSRLYQQYNTSEINRVTEKELIAIIMGYREYPIIIEGKTMDKDNKDYHTYILLIKDGYYNKTYKYDAGNNIEQIIYTYAGTV